MRNFATGPFNKSFKTIFTKKSYILKNLAFCLHKPLADRKNEIIGLSLKFTNQRISPLSKNNGSTGTIVILNQEN